MLFDNVFSNHISFLLMVVVAYAMCARGPLMQCVELDDFKVCPFGFIISIVEACQYILIQVCGPLNIEANLKI